MILQEQSMRVEDGALKFWLTTNAGNCGVPVTMGRQHARALATEILLALLLDESDRLATSDKVADGILEDLQSAPDLVARERLVMAGAHGCCDDQGDALEAATRPGRWDGEANAIG